MSKKPPLNDYDRKTLEWYTTMGDALGDQVAGLCQRIIVTEDELEKARARIKELEGIIRPMWDDCYDPVFGVVAFEDGGKEVMDKILLYFRNQGIDLVEERFGNGGPCEKPPAGWWCSRSKGHAGPCAAREKKDG